MKTVGGSIWSESKGTDSEKRLPLIHEGRVPDFFDYWMEEYISKVAAEQPGIGQGTPEHTGKTDGKETAETTRNKGWER